MSADKPEFKLPTLQFAMCCRTCKHSVSPQHEADWTLCCNRDGSIVPTTNAVLEWVKPRSTISICICEHYQADSIPPEIHAQLMRIFKELWKAAQEKKP